MTRPSVFIGMRYVGAKRRNQLVSFLSAISMTGLVVGVALLLAVLSVMNGFDRELREKILGLVPQAAIYHREGIEDWQVLQDFVERDKNIVAAAPFVQLQSLVSFRKKSTVVSLYGIDPVEEEKVSLLRDFISPEDYKKISNINEGVVLGHTIAEKMGVEAGQRVMFVVPDQNARQRSPKVAYLNVIHVLKTDTELDGLLAITSLEQAQKLSQIGDRVSGMRLKVNDLFNAPTVVHNILQELPLGFYSTDWTRTHGNLYFAIKMSKNMVGLLMSLIVAIAAFNVVSTLVMVVVEKQGDIAILRTLGASTKTVMSVFIIQGTIIGVVGTLLGVLFGCALSLGIGQLVNFIEQIFNVQFLKSDVYPLTYLPTEILWADILQVSITAISLCFIATIYPAWRASRVQPANALRYE